MKDPLSLKSIDYLRTLYLVTSNTCHVVITWRMFVALTCLYLFLEVKSFNDKSHGHSFSLWKNWNRGWFGLLFFFHSLLFYGLAAVIDPLTPHPRTKFQ